MYVHKNVFFRDIPVMMRGRLIKGIRRDRQISPVYFLFLGTSEDEEMEIISSLLYYSPISGERKDRLLIGIARDKSSAFELARYLTEKMYNELRRVDFKAFYGEMFKRER